MRFEWDSEKALLNTKKHGVSFELAITVFSDPHHLSVLDDRGVGEERWVTIGCSEDSKTLVVVHLYRVRLNNEEVIRIISARKATRKERSQYEKGV